ncbi:MAG: EamA family transporter [Acidimicrobiaceae bacterium]|nr:EamA family transporter [Acidimicrobiaceae bacterium]MYB87548.1 EamA family transporter [Acidimicrobiaceae bacterium]MYH92372.1 EamA family transporter [Acidimicrobiaceae bacterium]
MPVFLGGLAAALLGVGDFFGGVGGRRIDHRGAVVAIAWVASCVGAAVAGLFVLVFPPAHFGRIDFYWTLVALVFAATVRPLLYFSMERGPMAVVAPTFSLVSLVIPAVVGPLTGDPLGGAELAGVALAMPAVLLIASDGKLPTNRSLWSGEALLLGCSVGALLGCLSLAFAQISPDAGAMPAFITQLGAIGIIPLITRPFRLMAPLSPDVRRFGLLVGLIDIGAVIATVIAFQRGNVAVVAAMLGFAPVTTMTLAWRVYHEAVRRWQWVGAALGAAAIILFSTAT